MYLMKHSEQKLKCRSPCCLNQQSCSIQKHTLTELFGTRVYMNVFRQRSINYYCKTAFYLLELVFDTIQIIRVIKFTCSNI